MKFFYNLKDKSQYDMKPSNYKRLFYIPNFYAW